MKATYTRKHLQVQLLVTDSRLLVNVVLSFGLLRRSLHVRVLLCCQESSGRVVPQLMAFSADRNEVRLGIITKRTAPSHVVNIEILGASTLLTAPSIAFQDFSTQFRIKLRLHPNSRLPWQSAIIHVA